MSAFVDVDNYIPSPRTTHPAELLAEKNLAIAWLLGQLAAADAEILAREAMISELLAEAADRL